MTINSLWIAGELQPINHLTIASFKANGHEFVLWTYEKNLKADCVIKDARTILPDTEIFFYNNMHGGQPQWKFGGIADRLRAELIYAVGGWHVDLDVTCLRSFDNFTNEYVFAPHPLGVVANIIKAPKGSEFAKRYLELTKKVDANNTKWTKSFDGLIDIIKALHLEKFIQHIGTFGIDDDAYIVPLLKASKLAPPKSRHAIHWCGAMQWYKNYEVGSFYSLLLEKYNLLPNDKVSIVIPCYNQGRFLHDAIDCSLNQSHKNIEVIVVNDGSTDNTRDVAKSYGAKITYIEQANKGLSSARNTGIKEAKGKWIITLDADDKIHLDYAKRLIGVDDIVCPYLRCFGDNRGEWKPPMVHPTHKDFLLQNHLFCCAMFKKEVWEKVGGYDEEQFKHGKQGANGFEDYKFWLRATKSGYTVTVVPEYMFFYRKYGESMVSEANKNKAKILAYMKQEFPLLKYK